MPLRQVNAASRARERELHLERLEAIQRRPSHPSLAPWRAPPVPKPKPKARLPTHISQHGAPSLDVQFEQVSHAHRMGAIVDGTQRKKEKQLDHALEAGRADHGSTGTAARHRVQAEVAHENNLFQRRIREAQPKFASPSAIAFLHGKASRRPRAKPTAGSNYPES